MRIPTRFKKQIDAYAKAGFHVVDLDLNRGRGSHAMVVFAEFPSPQFLTPNITCPRALKNNIARFKRLTEEEKQNATVL